MCLENAVPYNGNKKVIGYKVLRKRRKNDCHDSTWYSSVYFKDYWYKVDGSMQKASGEFVYDYKFKVTNGGGVFHAFCKKEDALQFAEDLKIARKKGTYVIAKCEFPKGCEHMFFGQSKYMVLHRRGMTIKDAFCGSKMRILEIEEFKFKNK